jgi:hypothetical protein
VCGPLDWEAALVRLRLRCLPDGVVPGNLVAPGVARAHEVSGDLLARRDVRDALSVSWEWPAPSEGDLDRGAADASLVPSDRPVALAGLLALPLRRGRTAGSVAGSPRRWPAR